IMYSSHSTYHSRISLILIIYFLKYSRLPPIFHLGLKPYLKTLMYHNNSYNYTTYDQVLILINIYIFILFLIFLLVYNKFNILHTFNMSFIIYRDNIRFRIYVYKGVLTLRLPPFNPYIAIVIAVLSVSSSAVLVKLADGVPAGI